MLILQEGKNPVNLHVFFSCVVARGKAHVKRERNELITGYEESATILLQW
jgi:hypothetical protein